MAPVRVRRVWLPPSDASIESRRHLPHPHRRVSQSQFFHRSASRGSSHLQEGRHNGFHVRWKTSGCTGDHCWILERQLLVLEKLVILRHDARRSNQTPSAPELPQLTRSSMPRTTPRRTPGEAAASKHDACVCRTWDIKVRPVAYRSES